MIISSFIKEEEHFSYPKGCKGIPKTASDVILCDVASWKFVKKRLVHWANKDLLTGSIKSKVLKVFYMPKFRR